MFWKDIPELEKSGFCLFLPLLFFNTALQTFSSNILSVSSIEALSFILKKKIIKRTKINFLPAVSSCRFLWHWALSELSHTGIGCPLVVPRGKLWLQPQPELLFHQAVLLPGDSVHLKDYISYPSAYFLGSRKHNVSFLFYFSHF